MKCGYYDGIGLGFVLVLEQSLAVGIVDRAYEPSPLMGGIGPEGTLRIGACTADVVLVVALDEGRAGAEAVPGLLYHPVGLLMIVVECEDGETEFVRHAAVAAGVELGIAVLDYDEDVLPAALVVDLEVVEEIVLNAVGAGVDDGVAAAHGIGVEVGGGTDLAAGGVGQVDVGRGASEGLGVEVEACEQSIGEALGRAAVIQRTVRIGDHGEVWSILLQAVHKAAPYFFGCHQGFGVRLEFLLIGNASETVEEHVIVVAAHDLEFSHILCENLFGHRFLIVLERGDQFVAEHRAGDGGVPDISEGLAHHIPVVGVEVAPVVAVGPVFVGHADRAYALVGGKGYDAPISPVIVKPLDIGIGLTDKQGDIFFLGHHVLGGRVAIVDLVQHAVAGIQGEKCKYRSKYYLFHNRQILIEADVHADEEGCNRWIERAPVNAGIPYARGVDLRVLPAVFRDGEQVLPSSIYPCGTDEFVLLEIEGVSDSKIVEFDVGAVFQIIAGEMGFVG